jgi:hypothetical protein
MSQLATAHPDTISGNTQCALILSALLVEQGQWVPMPKLAEASGAFAVHSRIADLRRRGHNIIQRNEYQRHPRKTLSFYKLVESVDEIPNRFRALDLRPCRDA